MQYTYKGGVAPESPGLNVVAQTQHDCKPRRTAHMLAVTKAARGSILKFHCTRGVS